MMKPMTILLIGSGGREHALASVLAASPFTKTLYCAPGNAGIAALAACEAINPLDFPSIIDFCKKKQVDFVVVGPEAPLVAGIVDALRDAGIRAFGPSKAAAALEGSKGFMKALCARHQIPTARFARFQSLSEAEAYIASHGVPIVVKADGLAAGKGVVVAMTKTEAIEAVRAMFSGRFGEAGMSVVIEDYLEGEEVSFFVLSDGKNILPLAAAQDHKRAFDNDQGPNTGGMGAYSPAPVFTKDIEQRVMSEIIAPTIAAMAAEDCPFRGLLFAGLMITAEGPKLIEYNVRFGDPECQVLMRRLKSDLLPALLACDDGLLGHVDLRWRDEAALCVVMAARGYPDQPLQPGIIRNLEQAAACEDVEIFHAATRQEQGRLVPAGGRVLGVSAIGATVSLAAERAYRAIDKIDWPEGFCRRDIGQRAIQREVVASPTIGRPAHEDR